LPRVPVRPIAPIINAVISYIGVRTVSFLKFIV
jgi:hypothetical protein